MFGAKTIASGPSLSEKAAGVCRWLASLLLISALAGCAGMADAPRLYYQCPSDLSFEARLYADMALLEGLRGHVVLARQWPADAAAGGSAARPLYADDSVRAQFGLGQQGRLVRLDYTSIPAPVFCERQPGPGESAASAGQAWQTVVRAAPRPGPRNPPPFDPDAPVHINYRSSDGRDSQGEGAH